MLIRMEQRMEQRLDQLQHQQQDLIKHQQNNEVQFQNIHASMKKTEIQIGQLAEANQRNEQGKFPSYTEQAKAMTILRNGKVLTDKILVELSDKPVTVSGPSKENLMYQEEEIVVEKSKVSPLLHKSANPYVPPIPFPGRL